MQLHITKTSFNLHISLYQAIFPFSVHRTSCWHSKMGGFWCFTQVFTFRAVIVKCNMREEKKTREKDEENWVNEDA